ncbi:FMN-dependent NADH-azoreductase [Vibrio fluvialis]|uniref:FMN-dependent NADH-azoreductase n=1 Tax=Vibrio fluvialis TaxID=676 RepID=UPI00192C8FB9|nr:NAD(P)H-dependent oxidoreductase [Vibrio fluvialis]EKO3990057.1 flavodoxin family protein [Vibrio fluvialis]MBL4239760.1 NAD(P)H-dependent oxidoreductase [Vibrio fluvialis]MBL4264082.1 NAD(P)H-dependent oxidoreductase [Vibrio fluvialis]MBL4269114.1 NAD(P)H-dependent oxidoreductase [Vibrio fluvialis]MBL4273424.1 NAD(P)H-dependent oxidoreductase [Vibrio fluvialis]
MKILLINSSPRQQTSSTYVLAQALLQRVSTLTPVSVTEENVTRLAQVDSEYSISVASIEQQHDELTGSLAVSNRLIDDLIEADLVIMASPMHNFSLPSGLKSWVDHVVRAQKTFTITPTGKLGLLEDKPVYVLISSGGRFSGNNAYQPDFFTPYMTEVLNTIGINSVSFFAIESTVSSQDVVENNIEFIRQKLLAHLEEHVIKTQLL